MTKRLGYVRFTGEFKKLKGMGYKFGKYFASNYIGYSRGKLMIWKAGKDITYDDGSLYDLLSFLATDPMVHEYNPDDPTNRFKLDGIRILHEYDADNDKKWLPCTEETRIRHRDIHLAWSAWDKDSGEPAPPMVGSSFIEREFLNQIQELKDLGWLELVELDENGDEVKEHDD